MMKKIENERKKELDDAFESWKKEVDASVNELCEEVRNTPINSKRRRFFNF
jgi:hypothetical protein